MLKYFLGIIRIKGKMLEILVFLVCVIILLVIFILFLEYYLWGIV